ncbi:MAG: ABC transporter ATP-binding protein [Phycisphaerae bacterium]|nr:ABC transporter ATP-binding protein [Phycisphaerae bacterium]
MPATGSIEPRQLALEFQFRNKHPLRTLWRLSEGRHGKLALVSIFYVIKQSPIWAIPIITGSLITRISAIYAAHQAGASPASMHADIRWIIGAAALMFVLIIQNVPMHTLYATFLSSAVRQVQLVLRSAIVVRLQQLSMSFHDNTQSGKLQSKLLRDVETIENLSRLIIENLLQGIIILSVAMWIAISRRPTVAVFFMITVPAAVFLLRWFRQPMKRSNEHFREQIELMSARVSEMIEMIPITRAHAVEETEVEQIQERLQSIYESGTKLDLTNSIFASAAWATFQLFQVLCLLFNTWQCYRGAIKVGDVVMFQGFFGMIIGSVQGLLAMIPQFTAGLESMRSIGEVLESPDIEQNEGKRSVDSVAGSFDFDRVTFKYPNATRPAVCELSLSVAAGECVAVIGESGSGKSTLMNLIIGFRRPTSGRILLDGVDMAEINFRTFRRFLAVVPQQTVLFTGSVRDNITYGLSDVSEDRLQAALELANCTEFVSRLPDGLNTTIGSRGGKLSGGQRQRIAIARAMLRDPRVIILDEATSALDAESEFLVQQAINRLIDGRTTFIVAHRLSTIRDADRIIVMQDGRLIEIGSHAELLSRRDSVFSRFHALQA